MTTQSLKPSIYGTGLIALDVVISADESLPIRTWVGGTCGNVLTIMSFLGWESFPIARLNGDEASLQVKSDLLRWGVDLSFAECAPTSATPIIVQKIRRGKNGVPSHRFTWSCPHCGSWLPAFKPVIAKNVSWISTKMNHPKVFFMDRLSRAALSLAASASEKGALVVFEPSAKIDPRLMQESLQVAHVIKYADERFQNLDTLDSPTSKVLLELQTLGPEGMRYRSRLPKAKTTGWVHLPAFEAPVLADTCGAGDWCSAGIISKIGLEGAGGFIRFNTKQLRNALKYGQALAAWTCGFEGARGGMYHVDKNIFANEVQHILCGESSKVFEWPKQRPSSVSSPVTCPACNG